MQLDSLTSSTCCIRIMHYYLTLVLFHSRQSVDRNFLNYLAEKTYNFFYLNGRKIIKKFTWCLVLTVEACGLLPCMQ
jgi:hypothetical protein